VLATPSLAALKVIAEHSAGGKPLVDFLSAKTTVAARLTERAEHEQALSDVALAPRARFT
jgi:prephenate dehydrogenase